MKTKLILFIILYPFSLINPQGWQWQTPYPQGNFQSDVWALDSLTIVALADYGTILKSSDAGNTWKINYIGGDSIFYCFDLQFIDDIGWAVIGNEPTPRYIFKTTDRGDTWKLNTKFENVIIQSLCLIDETTGWFAGYDSNSSEGRVFKTTNGGESWINLSPDSSGILNDIFFIDSLYGYAVGNGGLILRTITGGINWAKQTSGDINEGITGVRFVDNLTGWIIGNKYSPPHGFVRKTTDGGNTWDFKLLTDDQLIFKKFFFKNSNEGFIPTFHGKIYSTSNGGDIWNITSLNPNKWLTSVHFSDQNNGWVVGDRGVIAKTNNGGISWTTVSKDIRDENFQAIKFIDTLRGWRISNKPGINGSILKTEDGGKNWLTQITDSLSHFLSIDLISPTTGWAAGSESWTKGVVYKTTDGGINWIKSTFDEYPLIASIDFIDSLTGWMIGGSGFDNSYFFKTSDGGNTWVLQFEDSLYFSKRIKFFDFLNGWACGWESSGSRFIWRTTNGGFTWNAHPADSEYPISDISFVTPFVGWAAGGTEIFGNEPEGGEGIISYTTDGGINWQRQLYIERDAFISLHFPDDFNGWAVGYNGLISSTSDGGLNWQIQWIPTGRNILQSNISFFSVNFVNPWYGWVCGNYGTIFKTNTGGQINYIKDPLINDNSSMEFSLYQNYPNPFNSQTIINYFLKREQHVTLSVYDILGQCIKVLVNENHPAGEYSILWDGRDNKGNNVASGVYLYILNSKSRFSVRKMLIIQ